MQIWDTAGQERFRTITKSYYRGSNGIVVVYDITNRESFENVKMWMTEVDTLASADVCRLIVGNKSDLSDKRQVSVEEGEALAREYGIPFMETSAKEALNVDNMFTTMGTAMKKSSLTLSSSNPEGGRVSIQRGQAIGSRGCC